MPRFYGLELRFWISEFCVRIAPGTMGRNREHDKSVNLREPQTQIRARMAHPDKPCGPDKEGCLSAHRLDAAVEPGDLPRGGILVHDALAGTAHDLWLCGLERFHGSTMIT